MAKVVAVMDMPCDCCKHCDIYIQEFDKVHDGYTSRYYCGKTKQECNPNDKPDWCPLLPEPNRKSTSSTMRTQWEFDMGWNACLDALEGKT